MPDIQHDSTDYDVAILGGSLAGSMAAAMLRKRGLKVAVLESRAEGAPLKAVVGEAFTEGTSVFVRHELGLGDWLTEHAYRKFGFDFVMQPRHGQERPRTLDGCHELLLSLTPLERIPGAFKRLIPTYHVDRPRFDAEVARRAQAAGAHYMYASPVRRVEFGDAPASGHRVVYEREGVEHSLTCRFVLDASGRRRLLGKQLGISHSNEDSLQTAAIWNRFTNIRTDGEFWQTFHGIDRRRHTIHWCGQGFWFWWIHIDDHTTSVGVSFDKRQHQVDVKAEDHGFSEFLAKFPALAAALDGAKPLEPYSYYAQLSHGCEHWLSTQGYALIGDASCFFDALYSIGIEMACRQLVAVAPLIEQACAGHAIDGNAVAMLNQEHRYLQESVLALNRFKYEHAWGQPHVMMQTALYDLAEIAELYHMQDPAHWTPENLARNYRLQWGSMKRRDALQRFMVEAAVDGAREREGQLLAKALLPGRVIYSVTWPLWHLPKARPYFFIITRAWGYMERFAQRLWFWPDFLSFMAGRRPTKPIAMPLRAEPMPADP
jgi:flavin-dependent dehydrogenase